MRKKNTSSQKKNEALDNPKAELALLRQQLSESIAKRMMGEEKNVRKVRNIRKQIARLLTKINQSKRRE